MIITSIVFQNFYSFKEKAKMNFLVNENAPQISCFGSYHGKNRFSKVSSIFGANASGKTNLIFGFEFLQWFISRSFAYSEEGFAKFAPFQTTQKEPSFFEVEFYIENVFYKLSLEINSERILSEILESRKKTRLIKLYSRQYISSSNSYKFDGKNIHLENNFIKQVRPNASIISTANQYNHKELAHVKKHWASIYKKSRRRVFFEEDFPFFSFNDASKFYHEHKEYFLKTKEFLKKADLGLSDIKIKTKEIEDARGNKILQFYPYGVHKNKDKTFQLPFPLESGGTQHLYSTLSFIFPALAKGSVCLIDEIESNLHPNILPAIVGLFTSSEINSKKAQLICTTHMPTLMSDLSKYQIFLVEKNTDCESEVYRLDEVQKVRSEDNLFKKYLAGAYGGVPDIGVAPIFGYPG